MKLNYTTKNGRISVAFEGEGQKQVWAQLANFQEIFEEQMCGKCGSENVRFVVRNVDDNDFYEMRCMERSCNSRLAFGATKKGDGLFPKRKDEAGNYKENNGWTKWNKDTKKDE